MFDLGSDTTGVAFMAVAPRPDDDSGKGVEVSFRRASGEDWKSLVRVAVLRGDFTVLASPRLLAQSDSLYAFFSLTQRDKQRSNGRLLYCKSGDNGETWATPQEIGPLTTPGSGVQGSDTPGTITAFDAAWLGDRLHLFFNSVLLYEIVSDINGAWSRCIAVAPTKQARSPSGYSTSSPSIAAKNGTGVLAWIDTRYRRSDQSWFNPFGGIPWSDNPDWANNDVLALRLNSSESPHRLTQDGAYAEQVRARAGKDEIYVAWAGRAKVGKTQKAYNEPPRILFTVLR
jgi:hypothetical protein